MAPNEHPDDQSGIKAVPVRLPADPDTRLGATFWQPAAGGGSGVGVVINPGAGIAAGYYHRYAAYLAGAGMHVLTYDYRGIGASRPSSLRGYPASVQTWGERDCTAAIEWVRQRLPEASIAVIGHSAGAFLTGAATNGDQIARFLTVGGHTGYWRDYAAGVRLPMFLLWHQLMPALTRIVGYFPGRRLRLLEDLPAGVALEWAQRRQPEFYWNFRNASGEPDRHRIDELRRRFASIRAPMLALSFSDDPFATPAATARLIDLFPGCQAVHERFSPPQLGQARIGHFGFFRSRFRDSLWPRSVDWLLGRESTPALTNGPARRP